MLTILARIFGFRFKDTVDMANISEGTHAGNITKLTDEAFTLRYLLAKSGSDVDHIAINGASDRPMGIMTDEATAAEAEVNVALLGAADSTRKVVASEAMDHNIEVFTAAAGKVQGLPVVAGTYFRIGISMIAASGDEEVLTIDPHVPIEVVIS